MAALVVGEGQRLPRLVPAGRRHLILTAEQVGGRLHHPTRLHLDDDGHAVVQRVAGLGVLLLVEHRLNSVSGTRLYVVDVVLRGGLDAHGGVVAAVGREGAPRGIIIGGVAVGGQGLLYAGAARPEVVGTVEDGERRVGGRPPEAVLLVGHLHPVALRSAPLLATWRLGVLLEQRHGVLLGVHLLVDGLLSVVNGVPELVGLAPLAVDADVAAGHLA